MEEKIAGGWENEGGRDNLCLIDGGRDGEGLVRTRAWSIPPEGTNPVLCAGALRRRINKKDGKVRGDEFPGPPPPGDR
ncbi:hypothetical protein J437_LFUL006575 [Ladona fulva]|uniref:Uncharacterized protein n=1 Tax=Ladona fulva TaxID=123851 RepID=A0A8K0NYL8_LADFU|nr:hypothetical protein J437_LFUL006575 [Ladona fulva]